MSKERLQKESKRIDELKRQIEDVAGPVMFGLDDCPSDIKEQFLERILAFEREDHLPLFDHLAEAGVVLPSPDDLTDGDLNAKLWEVIHAMALMGAYLDNTDHLSDRGLYEHLWREVLREPSMLSFPPEPGSAMHIDLVGSGSEEDAAIYLRYYADDLTRRDWAAEFPDETIPASEEPPYDRDRFLPQPDWNNHQRQA